MSKDLLPLDGSAWPRRCCGKEKGREARGQSEQRFGGDKTTKAETSKGKARNLCEHATNSKHDEETRYDGAAWPAEVRLCHTGREWTRRGQEQNHVHQFQTPSVVDRFRCDWMESFAMREMQSHDENGTVNNCHATSTLYARKNKRTCCILSLVSSCLPK